MFLSLEFKPRVELFNSFLTVKVTAIPIFDLNILKIIRGVYLNILLKTELLGGYGYF